MAMLLQNNFVLNAQGMVKVNPKWQMSLYDLSVYGNLSFIHCESFTLVFRPSVKAVELTFLF